MTKIQTVFVLRFFVCVAALGLGLSSGNALAQRDSGASAELDELLENADETEVDSAEEYALPVPQSAEEDSPVLTETGTDSLGPGGRSSEELFLPVPSDQVGLPSAQDETEDDFLPFTRAGDVRHDESQSKYIKPGWTLFGGYSTKTYEALIPESMNGFEVGTHIRFLSGNLFGAPMSLHGFGAVTFTTLNDVTGTVTNRQNGDLETFLVPSVQDRTYRIGGLAELQISRRFQLVGGVYKYFTEIKKTNDSMTGTIIRRETSAGVVSVPNEATNNVGPVLSKIDEDRISFGAGFNWDFYVIPHASFGVRGWVEPRYFSILLTFSAEPIPRNRNSLDFDM